MVDEEEEDTGESYKLCDLDYEMNTLFNDPKYFGEDGLISMDIQKEVTKIFHTWYEEVNADNHWTLWTKEDCTKFVMYAAWKLPFKKP